MSSFDLASQIAAAMRTVDQAFGIPDATYSRGDASVQITVTATQTRGWLASLDTGLSTAVTSTELIIDPLLIDFGSGPVDPETGDQIAFVVNGSTFSWEVRPKEQGRPAFWPADAFRTRWRVNVVLVSIV